MIALITSCTNHRDNEAEPVTTRVAVTLQLAVCGFITVSILSEAEQEVDVHRLHRVSAAVLSWQLHLLVCTRATARARGSVGESVASGTVS